MLQLVDHRGNVVVVDGGTRLVGQIRSLPAFFAEGAELEVVLIVGYEPVQLRVVVVEGCDCRAGAIAVVSLVEWVAGGRRFRPDDGKRPSSDHGVPGARDGADLDLSLSGSLSGSPSGSAALSSGAGLKGRLEDVSLVDVVQLLASGRRSGVISVRGSGVAGRVGMVGGQVVWADARSDARGDVVGEAAFFAVLAADRGRFAVGFDEPLPGVANITRETTFLLLEFLRVLDEDSREPAPTSNRGAGSGPVPLLESVVDAAAVVEGGVRPAMILPNAVANVVAAVVPAKAPSGLTGQTRLIPSAPLFAPAAPPLPKPTSQTATRSLKTSTTTKKKRASLPPQPERELEGRFEGRPTGRFAGFFAELQQSVPEQPLNDERDAAPPPSFEGGDDAALREVLAVTDAVRFASLAATLTGTSTQLGGPFGPGDRDTDIIDRALISA